MSERFLRLSRKTLFISFDVTRRKRIRRCREPSRLPYKELKRILGKRKLRRKAVRYVLKNFPKTSVVNVIVGNGIFRKELLIKGSVTFVLNESCRGGKQRNEYKNSKHLRTHIQSQLFADIETNPGPFPVDSLKTIRAPYSQGNTLVFGRNAGTQCVAMSFIALVYNYIRTINSSSDLVQVMNIGNELYTYLSQSARQEYLMLSELPRELCIEERNLSMIYSESYYGNLFQAIYSNIGDTHVLPLFQAFEMLLVDNYEAFILTININTVGIFKTGYGSFKVFDSHSRDCNGMDDVSGTCVLLEISCVQKLVGYFEILYFGRNESQFELKGVHVLPNQVITDVSLPFINISNGKDLGWQFSFERINNEERGSSSVFVSSVNYNNIDAPLSFTSSSFICWYSLCFSVMKGIVSWDDNTLKTIIANSNYLYKELTKDGTLSHFPRRVKIYDKSISIQFKEKFSGILRLNLLVSIEKILKKVICENEFSSSGFVFSIINSYLDIAFIFDKTDGGRMVYGCFCVNNNNDKGYVYTKRFSVEKVIHTVFKLVIEKAQLLKETKYEIQLVKCDCCLLSRKEKCRFIIERKNSCNKRRFMKELTNDNNETQKCKKKVALNDGSLETSKNMKCGQKKVCVNKSLTSNRIKAKVVAKDRYVHKNCSENCNVCRKNRSSCLCAVCKKFYFRKYVQYSKAYKNSLMSEFVTDCKSFDGKVYICRTCLRKERQKDKKRVNCNAFNKKKDKINSLDCCIQKFNAAVKEGPYYICVVCNRLLYYKSVHCFNADRYSFNSKVFTDVKSYDGKAYICKTCHLKIKKKTIPCQAVFNNLAVDDIPGELAGLRKLEQILIAQRIVFQKIIILTKGQQKKILGAVCNVPVSCEETCTSLPRAPANSGIILVKLKRKLQFKGHVYFEAVCPRVLLQALDWLKANNFLYENISVNLDSSYSEFNFMRNINDIRIENQPCNDDNGDYYEQNNNHVANDVYNDEHYVDNYDNYNDDDWQGNYYNNGDYCEENNDIYDEDESDKEDPLDDFRTPSCETCLQSIIPDYPCIVNEETNKNDISVGNEIYNIAPGEGRHPLCIMSDRYCEEFAFPVLFPKGRFGYKDEKEIKLTPVKYFNARLLHYSGRFAMNAEYLFFAQFVTEQKKVSDSINVALKKMCGKRLTASEFRSNEECVKKLIFKDQAYLFLRAIPGSPPYWQKFMFEVIAMVHQLGIPTWFMTLSCADLRWPELFHILARIKGENLSDDDIENLSYNEKCSFLNLNPVVAKHFQYRVEMFFKEILLSKVKPIGNILYYALKVEFQMRGSPHLHALIWTSDCPELKPGNEDMYIRYIDKHVKATLPDKENDAEMFELVSTFQRHCHSRSCRKYKNIPCRYNFGKYFTEETIIAKPISDDVSDEEKRAVLDRRSAILAVVKFKINEILDPSKSSFDENTQMEDILRDL